MSLALLQNIYSIAPNNSTPFQGYGGTPPYAYSTQAGGAGGTINPTSGQYTSGTATGIDTIVVTDSLGATAQATITVRNVFEMVCDIIQKYMGLDSTQVYLWNQKVDVPNDSRLYVAVGVSNSKPFGNTNYHDPSGAGLASAQSVNMQASLDIHIMSRGTDARDRKEEILMAVTSDYAIQQSEASAFRIATIPNSFVNVTDEEGAALLYHFVISLNVQYFVTKTPSVPCYNTFSIPTVVPNP